MKQPKRDRSRTRRGCHRGSYREVLGEASTHMLSVMSTGKDKFIEKAD